MGDRQTEYDTIGLETKQLKRRVLELEQALEASIRGELDAVVTSSPQGGLHYRFETAMLFKTFIEEMAEAAVAIEENGCISYCNESFLSLSGYRREELYGTLFSDYLPEEERNKINLDPRELETSVSFIDTCILSKAAKRFPIHLSITPLSFGTVRMGCITIHDLRSQRQEEDSTRFRLKLLDAVGQAVIATRPSGTIIYWNSAAERTYGWRAEEVIGKNILDVTPSTATPTQAAEILASLQKGEAWEGEFDVRDKSGRRFPIFISDTPILDKSGSLTEIIGVSTEISERRARERLHEESEARYRQFFELDLTGDIISNAGGDILECNPAFARIFGIPTADEAVEHNMHRFWPRRELWDEFTAAIASGRNLSNVEQRLVRLDGAAVHTIYNASGIFDDQGTLQKICAYFFDITDRKLLEAELVFSQKMEAVGRLAGGVAHDFNNMLMVIDGFSGLLQKGFGTDQKEHKYIAEIRSAAKRAANLTEQLLAFGRKQPLEFATFDLNKVIEDTAKLLKRVISENVHLELSLLPSRLPVKGDISQLGQIMINLSTNARDAMPDGGTLRISTTQILVEDSSDKDSNLLPEGAYALLEVRDTGIGMEDEVRANIFEPFYTTKKQGAGTGLGLASVYGIVKQSQGYIFCESKPGEGTGFQLYFPLLSHSEEQMHEQQPAVHEIAGGTETILLVEDDEQVRSVIGQMLRLNGYTCTEAHDGAEAIKIFNSDRKMFDLVVTDIIMPEIGGIQLAEFVQSRDPNMGILFMSGYSDDQMNNLEGITNPWRILRKPLDEQDLLSAIRELLESAAKGN